MLWVKMYIICGGCDVRRWADRRKYTKARKTMQYPTLPEGTKLITIPAHDAGGDNGGGELHAPAHYTAGIPCSVSIESWNTKFLFI